MECNSISNIDIVMWETINFISSDSELKVFMIIEIKIEALFRIAFLETTLVKKTFVFNSNVSGTWLYQLDFDLNGSLNK